MTSEELKAWRMSHRLPLNDQKVHRGPRPEHLSQAELGVLTGVSTAAVTLWERTERAVPKYVDIICRLREELGHVEEVR